MSSCYEENESLKFQLESASAAVEEYKLREKEMLKVIEGYKKKVELLEGELKRRPSCKQHVEAILKGTKLEKENLELKEKVEMLRLAFGFSNKKLSISIKN